MRSGASGNRAFMPAFVVAFVLLVGDIAAPQTPPQQPANGPGGADYRHFGVSTSDHGTGAFHYWIFEPDWPRPHSAPLIVFLHGWSGMHPIFYGGWIDHLVRKGHIVVYPQYQETLLTLPTLMTFNAIVAVRDAINVLESSWRWWGVRPELDHFALVGHSLGAVLAANVAALGPLWGLPAAKAVMSVEPGTGGWEIYSDYGGIPATTLFLVVVAEERIAGDGTATHIYRALTQIPETNKNLVIVRSDYHGTPDLVADHFSPVAWSLGFGVDALDWYGFWKLFDGLTDAAFYERHREYALGNTPEQRFMGYWSDGTPVRELVVTSP